MVGAHIANAVLVTSLIFVRDASQLWYLYIVSSAQATVSSFFFPAFMALMPSLVNDRQQLLRLNGLMQTVRSLALLVGPSLAGVVVSLWGIHMAFLIDGASFVVGAVFTLLLVPQTRPAPSKRQPQSLWGDVVEAGAFIRSSQVVQAYVVFIILTSVGFVTRSALAIPFMQGTLGLKPESMGLALSVTAGAAIAAGVVSALLSKRVTALRLLGLGAAFSGLAMVGLGLSTGLPGMLLGYAVNGFSATVGSTAMNALFQTGVPDNLRGRIISATGAIFAFSDLLLRAVASGSADLFGVRPVYLVAGGVSVVAAILVPRLLIRTRA